VITLAIGAFSLVASLSNRSYVAQSTDTVAVARFLSGVLTFRFVSSTLISPVDYKFCATLSRYCRRTAEAYAHDVARYVLLCVPYALILVNNHC